jgi:hypothetical protein
MLLLVAAAAVAVGSVIISLLSYALGFGGVGVLVVYESVLVFGAALYYCATSWPMWYRRRILRTRIILTLLIVFAAHSTIVALSIRRLRGEWGGPVWMAIGLTEIILIASILEAAVQRVDRR